MHMQLDYADNGTITDQSLIFRTWLLDVLTFHMIEIHPSLDWYGSKLRMASQEQDVWHRLSSLQRSSRNNILGLLQYLHQYEQSMWNLHYIERPHRSLRRMLYGHESHDYMIPIILSKPKSSGQLPSNAAAGTIPAYLHGVPEDITPSWVVYNGSNIYPEDSASMVRGPISGVPVNLSLPSTPTRRSLSRDTHKIDGDVIAPNHREQTGFERKPGSALDSEDITARIPKILTTIEGDDDTSAKDPIPSLSTIHSIPHSDQSVAVNTHEDATSHTT